MNFSLKKLVPVFFLLAIFTVPGAASAAKIDSFFDITYEVSVVKDTADGSGPGIVVVKATDNVTGFDRDLIIREVHRFEQKEGFGEDPDDLCYYRIVVDLGNNQFFRIEAESRNIVGRDGEVVVETEIQDIAPHRGHVTVLK